jgi:hypothetical protein
LICGTIGGNHDQKINIRKSDRQGVVDSPLNDRLFIPGRDEYGDTSGTVALAQFLLLAFRE